MTLTQRLIFALWAGMFVVIAVSTADRVLGEIQLFESDMQRDHAVMGRGIAAAVGQLWQEDSQKRALQLLAGVNQREQAIQIRWVSEVPEFPKEGQSEFAMAMQRGEASSWKSPENGGSLITWVPVKVGDRFEGAVELAEPLSPETSYLLSTLTRAMITAAALASIAAVVSTLIGHLFIARPIQRLRTHARRIASGDYLARTDVDQGGDLDQLAMDMNAMSAQLADANRRLAAEAEARLAALDQLRHAERVATVGRLASGIAHEIGTPLNVISYRTKQIHMGKVQGEVAQEMARIAHEQCNRITTMVQQLLAFARRGAPARGKVDLNALVRGTLEVLAPLLKNRLVETHYSDTPLLVEGDPQQLHQVFTNLLLNALQAGPGRIWVYTSQRTEQVLVTIQDEGPGVPEEQKSAIFEPFFTTKAAGQGTGLGLSIALGIVEEHGGKIRLESQAWRPLHGGVAGLGAGMKVLVVDDESEMRSILREGLEERKLEVVAAG